MSEIRFRNAAPPDAAALASLGRRTFTETFGHLYRPDDLEAFLLNHSEQRWAEDLANPDLSLRVAEAEGELVAYAKVGPQTLPFEPRGPALELRQFYLSKPWHGRGVSQELMGWAIQEAGSRGAEDLYLSVFVDNHRARRFYERCGFEIVGTCAFMVGSHADEDHIMRLKLGR